MYLVAENGLRYMQFPALRAIEGLFHGIFLRRSYYAQPDPAVFNIGLGAGNTDDHVWANRHKMLAAFDHPRAVFARQVHGAEVRVWHKAAKSEIAMPADHIGLHGDALVTDQPGHALVIQTADCQAVLLADPVKKVVANVHSGWRGSVQNIVGRTVVAMKEQFCCRPMDILCGIGPSLGPCCAEFVDFRREMPSQFWDYRRAGDLFDFWRISVDQLCAAGVQRDHITISSMCTVCNPHLFFSYRHKKRTGRFAAAIGFAGNVRPNTAT